MKLFNKSIKKQKGFHFILESTTNETLIEKGFVGQRFVTDTIPSISNRVSFKNSKGNGFSVSVRDLEDLSWAGDLTIISKANYQVGIGTKLQSKNSVHIIKLVDVVQ